MRVLHLTLKKYWFLMVLSNEKKEEYRELKPYWVKRLENKEFDIIIFKNGYAKDAPTIEIECKGVRVGKGRKRWGAFPNVNYFVLELGDIISTSNINSK